MIKALAEKHSEYIIERRRWYHAHPELSGEEVNTRRQIRADLEAMGITDIREMDNCYGLIATIHGGKSGKTVALRTDTDALKIREETGLPFAAENGAMHACGHDNHIAMLLGAAKILNDLRDELCGDVRLIVQPAEEVAQGALKMVEGGAMDGVDAVYGNHVWGAFPAGLIDATPGNRMACCHGFTIEIEGVAAHGSAPHLGLDAITVSAAVINALQQCVSRMNDPLNPLVLTIGTIRGGSRFNVIPNHVTMEGTVRTFSLGTEVEDRMRKVIDDTVAAFGTTATLKYDYMTAPVINADEQLNRLARQAIVKIAGEEAVGHCPTMMGSEDYSWLGDKTGVPYFYGFIGTGDAKYSYTNHHEKYDMDENILHVGAAVMAQFAMDYLAE